MENFPSYYRCHQCDYLISLGHLHRAFECVLLRPISDYFRARRNRTFQILPRCSRVFLALVALTLSRAFAAIKPSAALLSTPTDITPSGTTPVATEVFRCAYGPCAYHRVLSIFSTALFMHNTLFSLFLFTTLSLSRQHLRPHILSRLRFPIVVVREEGACVCDRIRGKTRDLSHGETETLSSCLSGEVIDRAIPDLVDSGACFSRRDFSWNMTESYFLGSAFVD